MSSKVSAMLPVSTSWDARFLIDRVRHTKRRQHELTTRMRQPYSYFTRVVCSDAVELETRVAQAPAQRASVDAHLDAHFGLVALTWTHSTRLH